MRGLIGWAVVMLLVGRGGAGQEAGPRVGYRCQAAPGLRLDLEGPVGGSMERVTRGWLIPAPGGNPAILRMFADRDRTPGRNLLPWSGEFAGKYLTGATQVLNARGDAELEAVMAPFVAGLVAQQDADGYLGPFPRGHRLTGSAPNVGESGGPTWDAWGHYHTMLGLLLWHERTGDEAALVAARKIGDLFVERFLGAEKRPRLVDTGSTEMNLAPAHGLALLYRVTREAAYLELARQIVDTEFAATGPDGMSLAGDYLRQGLANTPFFKTPRPRWESLHPMQALAELADLTGEARYREAFENLWWSIVELDRHNTGGFSSGEQAQGNPYHPGAIETCCTIAWMALSVDMLRLTANSIVADELELSTLNAALAHYHPSGRWSTYNTPMDGTRRANFDEIQFQCRPGSPELNCCSVNAARGLGLISTWALMRDDEGLLLNAYEPGSLETRLIDGTPVRLDVVGRYPADPNIIVGVNPEEPTAFRLGLRIPQWSKGTEVKVNGVRVSGVTPGRYLALERTWNPGDSVRITLDFSPHVWAGERECAGRASVYRGPILLAFDPRFNPEADVEGLAAVDLKQGEIRPILSPAGVLPAMVLVQVPTVDGGMVTLCDFASAGADGGRYRTWLEVEGAAPAAFSREAPLRTSRLP